jgi:hypothetical protein
MSVIYLLLVLLGLGFALFSSPNVSLIMGSVEPRYLGIASGLNASMRTLGMMTSMMIITLIFAYLMHGSAGYTGHPAAVSGEYASRPAALQRPLRHRHRLLPWTDKKVASGQPLTGSRPSPSGFFARLSGRFAQARH